MDVICPAPAALADPGATDTALHNLTWLCGMRCCQPQRSMGSTTVFSQTPLWNMSTGVPQKQPIPALPVNVSVTVYVLRRCVICWPPVIIQSSVVLTGVNTAHSPIQTDAVHAWGTSSVSTAEADRVEGGAWSAAGQRLQAFKGAWSVSANLSWRTWWVWEGALVNVHTAPFCWPLIALAAARRVTTELYIVAGETIAYKAIATDTRKELVVDEGVASFSWLHADGVIMTQITTGDMCPCGKDRG